MQASHLWNKHFDQAIMILDFDENNDEICVYKKMQKSMIVSLVLYIDSILLIKNDVGLLSLVKI